MEKRSIVRHGQRRWTEQQGRTALEEFRESGESAVGFARSKGVSTQRLAYWKKRLANTVQPAFVSVALPHALTSTRRAQIEVVSGNVVVRVREDLEAEHLARIVDVLARQIARC